MKHKFSKSRNIDEMKVRLDGQEILKRKLLISWINLYIYIYIYKTKAFETPTIFHVTTIFFFFLI